MIEDYCYILHLIVQYACITGKTCIQDFFKKVFLSGDSLHSERSQEVWSKVHAYGKKMIRQAHENLVLCVVFTSIANNINSWLNTFYISLKNFTSIALTNKA